MATESRCVRRLVSAALASGFAVWGAVAAAHAPLRVIAAAAADGGTTPALLRTNRGLVFVSGERAEHLCHAALGAHPSELLPAVALSGGGWVVATSRGVALVSAGGCEEPARSSLTGVGVQDVAADPGRPGRIYAVTADVAAGSGLYASDDGGASFAPVFMLSADDYLSSVQVSPAEPARIYLAGSSFGADSASVSHWVLVRAGESEPVRSDIELTERERQLRISAVHPTDADSFAVLVSGSQVGPAGESRDRLLLSHDGGESFATWHEAASIGQLSFAPDGRSAWLTSAAGLERSDDFGPFAPVPLERGASSVSWLNEQLYVGDAVGLFVSSDRGQSFRPLLQFWDALEPSACNAPTIEACRQDWQDLSSELETLRQSLATNTPAPSESALPPPAPTNTDPELKDPSAHSCTLRAHRGATLPLLQFALLLAALTTRRRKSSTLRQRRKETDGQKAQRARRGQGGEGAVLRYGAPSQRSPRRAQQA